jgi:hypothetical protein
MRTKYLIIPPHNPFSNLVAALKIVAAHSLSPSLTLRRPRGGATGWLWVACKPPQPHLGWHVANHCLGVVRRPPPARSRGGPTGTEERERHKQRRLGMGGGEG